MGYINTVDHAAWHLPCYSTHNCPKRLVDGGGGGGSGFAPDGPSHHAAGAGGAHVDLVTTTAADEGSKMLAAFLWALVMISLANLVFVFAVLASLKFRRPLNLFLLSVLASDVLMTLVVMPMHAIHAAGMASGIDSCSSWMFAHLVAVAARSWTIPATLSLHRLYDGLIPRRYLSLTLSWVWLASTLLCIPAIVSREALIEPDSCSIVRDNTAMLVYLAAMTFLLPACVLTPVLIKWSHLAETEERLEAAKEAFFDNNDEDEEEPQEEGDGIERLYLADSEFPSVMYTLGVFHAVVWSPFFILLLIEPVLVHPPSQIVSMIVVFLGYAQTMATPALVCLLSDRVRAACRLSAKHTMELFQRKGFQLPDSRRSSDDTANAEPEASTSSSSVRSHSV